jgi:hypothetical protein
MKCDASATMRSAASRGQEERQLAVTYRYQHQTYVPQIRMTGKWLARAGFTAGCQLAITVSYGRLVLTIAEPSEPLPGREMNRAAALSGGTGAPAARAFASASRVRCRRLPVSRPGPQGAHR